MKGLLLFIGACILAGAIWLLELYTLNLLLNRELITMYWSLTIYNCSIGIIYFLLIVLFFAIATRNMFCGEEKD
jgi:hypothetical protein